MTDTDNVNSIKRNGLIPSYQTGFGSPQDGGYRDPGGVYVVDNSHLYKGDTAPGKIGVVSATAPHRDSNYKPDRRGNIGSGYFVGRSSNAEETDKPVVPPLRDAMRKGNDSNTPYSFTLPMTPRTEEGSRRLINARSGENLSPTSAGKEIADMAKKRFPLHFMQKEDFANQSSSSSSSAPQTRRRSNSAPPQLSLPPKGKSDPPNKY